VLTLLRLLSIQLRSSRSTIASFIGAGLRLGLALLLLALLLLLLCCLALTCGLGGRLLLLLCAIVILLTAVVLTLRGRLGFLGLLLQIMGLILRHLLL